MANPNAWLRTETAGLIRAAAVERIHLQGRAIMARLAPQDRAYLVLTVDGVSPGEDSTVLAGLLFQLASLTPDGHPVVVEWDHRQLGWVKTPVTTNRYVKDPDLPTE